MYSHNLPRKRLLFRITSLGAILLGSFFLLAGALPAQARDDCWRRVDHAEWRLDQAVRHHGYYSREASHRRHELVEARESCRFERHDWR